MENGILRRKQIKLSVGIVLLLTLLSCSSSVTITTRRFSGVVLDSSMAVEIGTIKGERAEEFRRELIDLIRSSDVFTAAAAGGGSMAQSAILRVEGSYWPHEAEEFREETRGDVVEQHKLITYTAQFEYTITDRLSGERVVDGLIEEHRTESEKVESRGFFEAIINDVFVGFWKWVFGIDDYRELRKRVARRFVGEISPREVLIEISLFEDSDMPELKTGIGYARAGQWKDALGVFLAVIERHPHVKNIHKAYYNAGVAYEYDHQYFHAKDFLERAIRMSDEEEYQNELWRCLRYEREYQWREKYLEELRMRKMRKE